MIVNKYLIQYKNGIHARPATKIVELAGTLISEILVTFDNKTVNLKSIMGLLSLAIPFNALMAISFDGSDEIEASEQMTAFIKINGIGDLV